MGGIVSQTRSLTAVATLHLIVAASLVLVGGLGSIRGALVAGLLLGVVEVLTAAYVVSGLKEAVAFLILVLVLWTRPRGVFGRSVTERA